MVPTDRPQRFLRPEDVRLAARNGSLVGPTAGMANGFVQVNLVILPEEQANGFLRFCQANPKPCPVLAVSEPGERRCEVLGQDLDIARDVPSYRVYRNGKFDGTLNDVSGVWRDDLVTFALGCSFSFEHALLQNGVPVRHIEEGRNVPMYKTSIPLQPAGGFSGRMVVSMRPFRAEAAIRAVQITTRFPQTHGAPVHLGDPSLIGIESLDSPDYGDSVSVQVMKYRFSGLVALRRSRSLWIQALNLRLHTPRATCWSRIFLKVRWLCSKTKITRRGR